MTYTAFCQDKANRPTSTWIDSFEANDPDTAGEIALDLCSEAWECDREDVHLMGLAEGDVKIIEWNDLDA